MGCSQGIALLLLAAALIPEIFGMHRGDVDDVGKDADTTIVTGFWRPETFDKQKWASQDYWPWIENLMAAQSPMVVFTEAGLVQKFEGMRKGAADMTQVRVMEVQSFKTYRMPSAAYLRDMVASDSETYHYSVEYSMIMHEKAHLLATVARENPFGTGNFLWVDVGIDRQGLIKSLAGAIWPVSLPPSVIIEGRILALDVESRVSSYGGHLTSLAASSPLGIAGALATLFDHVRTGIGGGILGGSAASCALLSARYYEMLDELLSNGAQCLQDQMVLSALAAANPIEWHAVNARWEMGGQLWFHLLHLLSRPFSGLSLALEYPRPDQTVSCAHSMDQVDEAGVGWSIGVSVNGHGSVVPWLDGEELSLQVFLHETDSAEEGVFERSLVNQCQVLSATGRHQHQHQHQHRQPNQLHQQHHPPHCNIAIECFFKTRREDSERGPSAMGAWGRCLLWIHVPAPHAAAGADVTVDVVLVDAQGLFLEAVGARLICMDPKTPLSAAVISRAAAVMARPTVFEAHRLPPSAALGDAALAAYQDSLLTEWGLTSAVRGERAACRLGGGLAGCAQVKEAARRLTRVQERSKAKRRSTLNRTEST